MTIFRRPDGNGDMAFGQGLANFARDSEACAFNVRSRLLTIIGEWFLDTGAGVPYIDGVFARPVTLPLAEATIKRTILQTLDVATLNEFTMALDHNSRQLAVNCSLTTIYGDVKNIAITL